MPSEEAIIRSSGENVIELIKDHRDELIHRLVNSLFLKEYLLHEFQITEISTVKLEFIKRALVELEFTPVDLSHYAALMEFYQISGSI